MDLLTGALFAALLAGTLLAWAAIKEARRPAVEHLMVPVATQSADALRLLHVTDTHGSRTFETLHLQTLVDPASYDLLVMTGDLVTWAHDIPAAVGRLLEMKEASRILFVPGNHDILAGHKAGRARMVEEELARAGVRILTNTTCVLDTPIGKVLFGGTDDKKRGHPLIPDSRQAAGIVARVLMAHNPDILLDAPAGHWDLVLSGHTHGGQIRFPLIGPVVLESVLGRRFWRGPAQYKGATVLVSQGCGTSYLPMRQLCPPQVWLCHLVASRGETR